MRAGIPLLVIVTRAVKLDALRLTALRFAARRTEACHPLTLYDKNAFSSLWQEGRLNDVLGINHYPHSSHFGMRRRQATAVQRSRC